MRRKTKKQKKKKFLKLRIASYALFLYLFSLIAVNIYHHPGVLLTPISSLFIKTPIETWRAYQSYFLDYSSEKVSASFLAALAQTESMGNPLALTDWKAAWDYNPLRWFRPASTATGLFQVTKPTWDQYKKYCWQEESVVQENRDTKCFANPFRFRFSAKDSVYLTSAWFHGNLDNFPPQNATDREKFLSVLHLCGLEKAKYFLKNKYKWSSIGRCGTHNPISYFHAIQQNKLKIQAEYRSTLKQKLAKN